MSEVNNISDMQANANANANSNADAIIKTLAQKWYNNMLVYNICIVRLNIKKIDGVDVEVTVTFDDDIVLGIFFCKLSIETPLISDPDGNYYPIQSYQSKLLYNKSPERTKWTQEMMEKSIVSLQGELKEFRYHKRTNKFMNKQDVEVYDAEVSIFESSNISYISDICCVCHDVTSSKTECNHSLCLSCWSGLKVEYLRPDHDDEDEDYYDRHLSTGSLCPICRRFMQRVLGSSM